MVLFFVWPPFTTLWLQPIDVRRPWSTIQDGSERMGKDIIHLIRTCPQVVDDGGV